MSCPACHEQVEVDGLKGWCPVCGQAFVWVSDTWYPLDETAQPERGGYSYTEQD